MIMTKNQIHWRAFSMDPVREVERVDQFRFRELGSDVDKQSKDRTAMQRNGEMTGLLYFDREPTAVDFEAISNLLDAPTVSP